MIYRVSVNKEPLPAALKGHLGPDSRNNETCAWTDCFFRVALFRDALADTHC